MARVNWNGTEIEATLIDQLPNGNYKMRSKGHAHRIEPGTVIEVTQSQIVGLSIGGVNFNGPGLVQSSSPPPAILLAPGAAAQIAGQASGQTFTSVIPPAPTPVAANDTAPVSISPPSNEAAKINTPAPVAAPAAPQPQGKPMSAPLVEIKGLGNAITSVRSGLAGVRALAADVQVSAGALTAELTDVKQQIEDARAQIKTEASIMGNSGG